MKTFLKQSGQILGRAVFFVALAAALTSSAQTETNNVAAAPTEPIFQKSVFVDNLKSGRDPFFPRSTRRGEKDPAPDTKVVVPVVQLALKGISGPTNRRFALINNQPLAAGETAYVRVPGGQVKVHCWEVREDSVVVSVEGNPEKKELRLREGL